MPWISATAAARIAAAGPQPTPGPPGRLARALSGIRTLPACLSYCMHPAPSEAPARDGKCASSALMSARNIEVPALYYALQEGSAATVAALGRLHGGDAQTLEQRATWLAARRPDGLPGLHMAMELGHAGAIEAFGRILEQSNLDAVRLTRVLAARALDGYYEPGLFMALQNGNTDAIRSFAPLLDDPRLNYVQRFNLLAAGRLDGTPGLSMAMQSDHDDAVRAFGDLLMRRYLHPDDLMRLLDARNAVGRSGLSVAMQHGRADAIRAFGDVLSRAAGGLGEARVLALLEVDARPANDETQRVYAAVRKAFVSGAHPHGVDLDFPVPLDDDDGPR